MQATLITAMHVQHHVEHVSLLLHPLQAPYSCRWPVLPGDSPAPGCPDHDNAQAAGGAACGEYLLPTTDRSRVHQKVVLATTHCVSLLSARRYTVQTADGDSLILACNKKTG